MQQYRNYKDWWIQYEAPNKVPTTYWGDTSEEAFERHVNDMGLYELFETLSKERDYD